MTKPPPSTPQPDLTSRTIRVVHIPIASTSQLGDAVKSRRKVLKMNQQRVADAAGVGRRFVSELEAGKQTLELEKALTVCKAIGLDLFARPR